MEQWNDVRGFEGSYQVSNLGRVYSYKRNKVLKACPNNQGYLTVNLYKNDKPTNYKIHVLVCSHFIPNTEKKKCINHMDGVKANNCINNLEWVTHSENTKHAFAIGLMPKRVGANNPRAKLVLNLETGIFYETCMDAAKTHLLSQPYLSEMLSGVKPNKTKLIYV